MTLAGAPYRKPRRAVFASTLAATWVVVGGVLVVQNHLGTTAATPGTVAFQPPATSATTFPTTSETAPDTTGPPSDLTRDLTASASGTAPDNFDDALTPTSYVAEQVLDGDRATAWRVEGDGAGVTVTLTFPATARIARVGLIPGYAKVDPKSHRNRFLQNRRIREVRWHFDNGTVVSQRFQDRASMQTIAVDVDAGSVVIEIVSTRPGHPDYDYTAISEVLVVGSS